MKKGNYTTFLLILVTIALFAWLRNQLYGNCVRVEGAVTISTTELERVGGDKIIDSLIRPKLKHLIFFDKYAERLNLSQRIKPGYYELVHGQDIIDVVRMFKIGIQNSVEVTFNNLRDLKQLSGKLSEQLEADSLAIYQAMTSEKIAHEVGLKPEEIIALFIPNTYDMWWLTSPSGLVHRMRREYDMFWNERRETARKELGLSRVEVSTLASIVYMESSREDEMPRIAGVYVNRIKRGIKLQADPTVVYATGDYSIKRLRYKHLNIDSPYNTYKHKGLPPGPIAMPSIAAIDAVLNCERHNYIFFCARPEMDGYHNFATTYAEHLANGRKYSSKLNSRGIH